MEHPLNHKTGEAQLQSVDDTTLQERVVRALQAAILRQNLAAGERLIESKIAATLGVSRGPLRAALRELELQGLVRIEPRMGTYVERFGVDDVREITSIRANLESFAVELAVDVVSADDLKRFEDLTDLLRDACQDKKLEELVELDLAFHDHLVLCSNHRRLQKIISTLRPQFALFVAASKLTFPTHDDLMEIAEWHERIARSIAERDKDLARRTVADHITTSGARLVSLMLKREDTDLNKLGAPYMPQLT